MFLLMDKQILKGKEVRLSLLVVLVQGLGWVLCRVGRRHQDQLYNQALVPCFLVYIIE